MGGVPPEKHTTPLQPQSPRIGHLGHTPGLYMNCSLDGHCCRALVDTGSSNSLVCTGVLPNTDGPHRSGWTPTTIPLTTVMGERAEARGKKLLHVAVGGRETTQEFWMANIQEPCIVWLDLLEPWWSDG